MYSRPLCLMARFFRNSASASCLQFSFRVEYCVSAVSATVSNTRTVNGRTPLNNVKSIVENGTAGDQVRVQGWVRGIRKMKTAVFLEVNDGSTHRRVQVVVPASAIPENLSLHCSVDLTGMLEPLPHKPGQLEVHPIGTVKVIGPCSQDDYPLRGKIRYEMDYIRQYVHLRAKTNKFASLFRLRSNITDSIRIFFSSNDFVNIHSPVLTSNDCEGAGEVFGVHPVFPQPGPSHISPETLQNGVQKQKVDPATSFFDRKVYLTVSGQLHLEAMASGLGRVWTISPVFRAENSRSTRHLAEFYMVEAEMAFAYDLRQVLDVMENLVKSVIEDVLTKYKSEWDFVTGSNAELEALLQSMLKQPFTVMTFEEACQLLETKTDSKVVINQGLSREQELLLVQKLNDNIPIFVVDWPASIKPFYVRSGSSPELASAVDLLVPGVGELCGGSLREFSEQHLIDRIKLMGLTDEHLKSLDWYLDLRRFGGVPTGGFGLGFDRLLLLLIGNRNIKDVVPFPRWTHNCPM